MFVVVDTNVVISGLLFGGIPSRLVSLWKAGLIKPIFSKKILDEYLRVLAYPKFSLSEAEIAFLLKHEILPYFQAIDISSESHEVIIESDPDDDKFLLCALTGTCDFIISGDRHLLELKSYHGTKIATPADFLERIKK
ncbi:MAG: putative toxin-antitoxin system toxin component, PIN family [Pseudomonadota bacterium]|nr:putative toxin-antitoxin system toxin component, PIN family [Pseudomonadota bacterium]